VILVVFYEAVALVILTWPRIVGSLGAVDIYPLLRILAWVVAIGSRG